MTTLSWDCPKCGESMVRHAFNEANTKPVCSTDPVFPTTTLQQRADEVAALDAKRTREEWSWTDAELTAALPRMFALIADLATALQTAQKQIELLMQEPGEDEREAFEKWWCEEHHPHALQEKDAGQYIDRSAGIAWDAWLARAKIGR